MRTSYFTFWVEIHGRLYLPIQARSDVFSDQVCFSRVQAMHWEFGDVSEQGFVFWLTDLLRKGFLQAMDLKTIYAYGTAWEERS